MNEMIKFIPLAPNIKRLSAYIQNYSFKQQQVMIYVEKIRNRHIPSPEEEYPYNIPALKHLKEMVFQKEVTFIAGENGSGKSTLTEAIAVCAGFNPEGGGRNFHFGTRETHSQLYQDLLLIRSGNRNKDGYFMRAESFYNVSSEIDNLGVHKYYGDKSLHSRSHGESFLALFNYRLFGKGLYIFDEPEAALSPQNILALLARIKQLVKLDSQFIIATHSPILLAYPGADIYTITNNGPELVAYEETSQFQITKYFINNYPKILNELLRD